MSCSESVPPRLRADMAALWEKQFHKPSIAYESSRFKALVATFADICRERWQEPRGNEGEFALALQHFFQRYGAPWYPGLTDLDAGTAAAQLWTALSSASHQITYLLPLDQLDGFPETDFGPAKIRNLRPAQLGDIIHVSALKRRFSGHAPNLDDYDGRQWLIVKERVTLPSPRGQAWPDFDSFLDGVGEVKPYPSNFPPIIEQALFAIILLAWETLEDWGGDWKPFRIPWVYQMPESAFSPLELFPKPATLSWGWAGNGIDEGEMKEIPATSSLDPADLGDVSSELQQLWSSLEHVSPPEGEPHNAFPRTIRHFMLRAFLDEGFDQFLWNVIVIDACLGKDNEGDQRKKIAYRAANLCQDASMHRCCCDYYKLRSAYVHGRDVGGEPIQSNALRGSRALSRSVVRALLRRCAEDQAISRDVLLTELWDKNMRGISGKKCPEKPNGQEETRSSEYSGAPGTARFQCSVARRSARREAKGLAFCLGR